MQGAIYIYSLLIIYSYLNACMNSLLNSYLKIYL